MGMISLVGLNKAEVLAALYNTSKPQGMGFLHYNPKPMTTREAEILLQETTDFDYLKGRVMKVSLKGDGFDSWAYDRDNGEGAAERAIAELVRTGDTNPSVIQEMHDTNTLKSAEDVKTHLNDKGYSESKGGVTVFHLGLEGVADKLGPAVDKAIKDKK